VRDQEQNPIGVAVYQTRHGAVIVLAQRIFRLSGRTKILIVRRDYGAAERLSAIRRIEKACVIGSNSQWQGSPMTENRSHLIHGQLENRTELFETSDPVPQLPVPVVPFGRTGIWKKGFAEPFRG
jgi:hypothetical protein